MNIPIIPAGKEIPPIIFNNWAKWDKNAIEVVDGSWHPLIYHSLDAALVAWEWITRSKRMGKGEFFGITADLSMEQVRGIVCFWCFMHDAGKAHWFFQSKIPELWAAINGFCYTELDKGKERYGLEPSDKNTVLSIERCAGDGGDNADIVHISSSEIKNLGHGENLTEIVRTGKILEKILGEKNLQKTRISLVKWLKMSAGHHDIKIDTGGKYSKASVYRDPVRRNSYINVIEEMIKLGESIFLEPVGLHLNNFEKTLCPRNENFKGVCSVSDWIASTEGFFPFVSKNIPLDIYARGRAPSVKNALDSIGIKKLDPKTSSTTGLFPFIKTLTPVQEINAPLLPGSLTIVEAPTGSGKTEFALSRAVQSLIAGHADGITLALPTQATTNAMYDRVVKLADMAFPGAPGVVLAHGKSKLHPGFLSRVLPWDEFTDGFPEGRSEEEDERNMVSRWVYDFKTRALLGSLCVCTVDQVLIGAVGAKHSFVRQFATSKNILVIDEVHSYGAYTDAIIDDVLKLQRDSGGSAILLSATLTEERRRELASSWSGGVEPPKEKCGKTKPYPLVTVVTKGAVKEFSSLRQEEEKVVKVDSRRTRGGLPDEAIALEMLSNAAKGAKVCMICNTIKDSLQVYDMLKEFMSTKFNLKGLFGVDIRLFHSRFRFKDRQHIEDQIINEYGKDSIRGRGSICVATQVVEQSLDLDFDILYTQICPIDILLQRVGRLWRHKRSCRPLESPRVVVISNDGDSFGGSEYIYGNMGEGSFKTNPSLLWRTRAQLENCDGVLVAPEAYRTMIDPVYAGGSFSWRGTAEPCEITEAHDEWRRAGFIRGYTAKICVDMAKDGGRGGERITREGDLPLALILYNPKTLALAGNPSVSLTECLGEKAGAERIHLLDKETIPCGRNFLAKATKGARHRRRGDKHFVVAGAFFSENYTFLPVEEIVSESDEAYIFQVPEKNERFIYTPETGLYKEV